MADLPVGWDDRHNQMSEKDIKLGGMAAKSFGGTTRRNAYDNDNDSSNCGYKTSDQVREYYLSEMQRTAAGSNNNDNHKIYSGPLEGTTSKSNNLPDFWEDRQKEKELQAKQMGVFSRNDSNDIPKTDNIFSSKISTSHEKGVEVDNDASPFSAELALVQIATHTLEKLTIALEGKEIKIPMKDRAAFAKAIQGSMNVMAKQA